MIRRLFAALIVASAVTVMGPVRAQKPDPAVVMLEAARQKETLDGDLQGAIKQYQAIVSTYGKSNRAAAATALVQMAECFRKLGDTESQKIYERVVREFSDQKEQVAVARARLGTTASVQLGDRPVWTGPDVDLFGHVSPDGRFITFVDWTHTGNVMVRDTRANANRAITKKTSWKETETGEGGWSTISPDGKFVAYAWTDWDIVPPGTPHQKEPKTIQIAPLDDKARAQTRQLFLAPDDIDFVSPYDWSPDGKWLAVLLENRKEGAFQIGTVAVRDGVFTRLKSISWPAPTKLFFSGDSKYIAYDLPGDESDQRDIFAIAIDGSREMPLVVHPANDKPLGFSPDGKRLLFASDRTGTPCLWAQPIADGKPAGAPELLKSDIGSAVIFPLGVTATGTLYLYKDVSSRDIRIASFDAYADAPLGATSPFTQGFLSSVRDPDWSPDGKFLLYPAACGNRDCIAVRSVDSGQVRKLPAKMGYIRDPRWSPDGRSILSTGTDSRGRWGVFQIDPQTGAMTTIVSTGNKTSFSPRWSPNGRTIYYGRMGDDGVRILVEREMPSGVERVICRCALGLELSPDGRFFSATKNDLEANVSTLVIMPAGGGEARELMREPGANAFLVARSIAWTPDSRSLVVAKRAGTRVELWLVPIDNGQPRRLAIDASAWAMGDPANVPPTGFSLSRDGRRIAFLSGKSAREVWALENFLAVPSTNKP